MSGWTTVRVFISSTFQDMHAERDHLVRFVFPRLRETLLPHSIHVVDVDLRWGVTADQDVLEACREIMDECHPRYVCLLGERYGFVPPNRRHSITAEEIHYGVLDRAGERPRAFFYFRDPAATARMVEREMGEFREASGSAGERLIRELKEAIVHAGWNPVVYSAEWSGTQRRLIGLEAFGARVYADVLGSIQADPQLRGRFAGEAERADEFGAERAAIQSFLEERTEGFIAGGRQDLLDRARHHALAEDEPACLCIAGEAGSGKSALLAVLARELSQIPQGPCVLAHFVGASPKSADLRYTLQRLRSDLGDADGVAADPEQLWAIYRTALRQAAAERRVILILDGVDAFAPSFQFPRPGRLLEDLPPNVRVIFSASREECARLRPQPVTLELVPLEQADRKAIAGAFLRRYRKRLAEDAEAGLLAKADAGMPLYLAASMEELRTLGVHEEIADRVRELPGRIPDLFDWILRRLESDSGLSEGLVSRLAALLAASRFGLSVREFTELTLGSDPHGHVAAVIRLLRPYLMRRGELLTFYYGEFRDAVERRYLNDADRRRLVRLSLGRYFESRDDDRKLEETLWQYVHAGERTACIRWMEDVDFLEASCRRSLDDLIEDFRLALGAFRPDVPSHLVDILRTLQRDAARLREHPDRLPQQLLNDAPSGSAHLAGILASLGRRPNPWVQIDQIEGPGRDGWRMRLAGTTTGLPGEAAQIFGLHGGRFLAVLRTGEIWTARTGLAVERVRFTPPDDCRIQSACLCGSTLLLLTADGRATLLGIEGTSTWEIGALEQVVAIAASQQGGVIALRSDGRIVVFDRDGRNSRMVTLGQFREVNAFAVSPDGKYVLVVEVPGRDRLDLERLFSTEPGPLQTGLNSNLTVADLQSETVVQRYRVDGLVTLAAPSLSASGAEFLLSIADGSGGRIVVNSELSLHFMNDLGGIAVSPGNRYIALLQGVTLAYSMIRHVVPTPPQVQIVDAPANCRTTAPLVVQDNSRLAFSAEPEGRSTSHQERK
jgi:hypothetical protein